MKKTLMLLLFLAGSLQAVMFKDGDRVAFIGDSITVDGRYIRILSDYYLTRFPDADIRFTNCGRGGGGARDGAVRFEEDVLARNPNVLTIMFGMNDIGRGSYRTNATPKHIKDQEQRIKNYRKNMANLLNVCQSNCPNASIYLFTPSITDDTSVYYRNKACVQCPGSNAGLGACAAILREEAQKRGALLVDFYTVLNAYLRERRRTEPDFKYAQERVHGGVGMHLLMAMAILEAQNAERVVSDIAIREGRCLKSIRAEVSDIVTNEFGEISFTALEKSLPMPFHEEVADFTNAPPIQAFNQQILTFYCLGEGDWTLEIDGTEICTASHLEWERGVNIAFNPRTPQHRQAMKVLEANYARSTQANSVEAQRPAIRKTFRGYMPQEGLDPNKAEDREKFFKKRMENMFPPYKPSWTVTYNEWDDQERLLAECNDAWPAVRALAKPIPHAYKLRKTK